jgi:hypothetical protein
VILIALFVAPLVSAKCKLYRDAKGGRLLHEHVIPNVTNCAHNIHRCRNVSWMGRLHVAILQPAMNCRHNIHRCRNVDWLMQLHVDPIQTAMNLRYKMHRCSNVDCVRQLHVNPIQTAMNRIQAQIWANNVPCGCHRRCYDCAMSLSGLGCCRVWRG